MADSARERITCSWCNRINDNPCSALTDDAAVIRRVAVGGGSDQTCIDEILRHRRDLFPAAKP